MDGIFIWCLDGALLGMLLGMWGKGHDMSLTFSLFVGALGAIVGGIFCLAAGANNSPFFINVLMLLLGITAGVMLVRRVNRY